MYLSPRFEILPSRSLSPEEFCRGTRPSQAAKCRPDRNWEESPTLATMAVAVIGPMPGMVARRWLCSLLLCHAMISSSSSRIRRYNCLSCSPIDDKTRRASAGIDSSLPSSRISKRRVTFAIPCATTIPYSARCPRNAFTSIVRCRTNRSRAPCRINTDCWSVLLTGTNLIEGCPTASQIASASAESFLLRLT